MTSELRVIVLVMISDEQAAGRIVVELGALVRFNATIDRQLHKLESQLHKSMPQLARRGGARSFGRITPRRKSPR